MKTTRELFSRAEIDGLRTKKRVWSVVAAVLGAGALLACVLFCVFTNTLNSDRMQLCAMATSSIAGCVIIYIVRFCVRDTASEIAHAELMLTGERAEHVGEVKPAPTAIKIRGSITARRVSVGGDKLMINERKAKLLPVGRARVWTVMNYITAWEEADDEIH